jgi:hypothetical protein
MFLCVYSEYREREERFFFFFFFFVCENVLFPNGKMGNGLQGEWENGNWFGVGGYIHFA